MMRELLNFTCEELTVPQGAVSSFIERRLNFFPLRHLARLFDNRDKCRAWEQEVCRILNSRTANDFSTLTNPEEAALAHRIIAVCAAITPWPNAHFYLEDTIRCIIDWDAGDLCEAECLMELEDQFHCEFPEGKAIEPILNLTLRQFMQYIQTIRTKETRQPHSVAASRT